MRLMQVITDYIARSILTTIGDMVVRGIAQPERLAAGALNEILIGQGAGVIPAWGALPFSITQFAIGSETINSSTTTTISGVGFTPVAILFYAVDSSSGYHMSSYGVDLIGSCFCKYQKGDGTGMHSSDVYSWWSYLNSSNHIRGYATNAGSDGFDIISLETGTRSADIHYLCIG